MVGRGRAGSTATAEGVVRDRGPSGKARRRCLEAADPVAMEMEEDDDSTRYTPLLPGLPDELAMLCLARVSDVRTLRMVCKLWSKVVDTSENFLTARAHVGQKSIDWLYFLVRGKDGFYSWHAYDHTTSMWHALPAMPEEVDFQLTSPGSIGLSHQVQCVSTGKKVVMLAGLKRATRDKVLHQWSPLEPALEHPWIFDPRKRMWKKGRPFSTPRRWCVCGVVNAKVYVASGCGLLWNMNLSKSTDVYDPENDVWESLPLTLNSSKFSGEAIPAVSVEGKLYVVSGKGVFMKVGAVFCPVTRTWSNMPERLRIGWVGSCVGVDDQFFVVDDCAGKLSVFDTVANRWVVILEDTRLKGFVKPTAGKGKICGLIEPLAGRSLEEEGSCVRIIDVNSRPPTILELPVPQGRVVSIQVLERLNLNDR